jgi:hypothetical protein
MGSRGKKKTTFEKLARESRLREKRIEKAARKEARKRASEDQGMATHPGELPGVGEAHAFGDAAAFDEAPAVEER